MKFEYTKYTMSNIYILIVCTTDWCQLLQEQGHGFIPLYNEYQRIFISQFFITPANTNEILSENWIHLKYSFQSLHTKDTSFYNIKIGFFLKKFRFENDYENSFSNMEGLILLTQR